MNRRYILFYLSAFIVILLTGLFLRTYNLDSIPVFADEAIYVRWSQIMKAEPTLRFLPLSDGKQPLFMWSVMPVLKVIDDPLIVARLVSVICGIGSSIGIFILSLLLFSKTISGLLSEGKFSFRSLLKIFEEERSVLNVAVISTLIYSVSPFSVFFDRLALADSMLLFFGLLVVIFGVLTVKTLRFDMSLLTGFAMGGVLLTKSPGFFFLLLLPATIFLSELTLKHKQRTPKFVKISLFWLITSILGYSLYNILRLGPNFGNITSRNQDYIYPLTHVISSPLDPLKPFMDRIFEYLWILGPWILIPLALIAVADNYKIYFRQTVFLVIMFLVPWLISSELSKTMTARYIYFTYPYFIILASSVFVQYFQGEKPKIVLNVMKIFLVIFVLLALRNDYYLLTNPQKANLPRSERSGYLEEWTSGIGIKEISEIIQIEHLNNKNKKIVVGTEGYFGTLPDGMQMYLSDYPDITVIGTGLDFIEVPDQLKNAKLYGDKVFFVVNSSRIKFSESEFNKLGLKVVAKFKKADRPVGREYVQYGESDYLYLFELL